MLRQPEQLARQDALTGVPSVLLPLQADHKPKPLIGDISPPYNPSAKDTLPSKDPLNKDNFSMETVPTNTSSKDTLPKDTSSKDTLPKDTNKGTAFPRAPSLQSAALFGSFVAALDNREVTVAHKPQALSVTSMIDRGCHGSPFC